MSRAKHEDLPPDAESMAAKLALGKVARLTATLKKLSHAAETFTSQHDQVGDRRCILCHAVDEAKRVLVETQ